MAVFLLESSLNYRQFPLLKPDTPNRVKVGAKPAIFSGSSLDSSRGAISLCVSPKNWLKEKEGKVSQLHTQGATPHGLQQYVSKRKLLSKHTLRCWEFLIGQKQLVGKKCHPCRRTRLQLGLLLWLDACTSITILTFSTFFLFPSEKAPKGILFYKMFPLLLWWTGGKIKLTTWYQTKIQSMVVFSIGNMTQKRLVARGICMHINNGLCQGRYKPRTASYELLFWWVW